MLTTLAALLMLFTPITTPPKPDACSQSDTQTMTPADLLQRLDDFRNNLPVVDRSHLDAALPRDTDGGIKQCDGIQSSRASCEASAYMPALRATGLMPRFLASICSASAITLRAP